MWLSNSKCLDRFAFYKSVFEFLQESDVELCSEVKEMLNDDAYLSDIFRKHNSLNHAPGHCSSPHYG